jgi:A118 family predicted phage portal protein
VFAPSANLALVPAFGLASVQSEQMPVTGLPIVGATWPPKPFDVSQKQFHIWDSWYAGDVAELQNIYIQENLVRPTAWAGGLVGRLQRFFWGRPNLQNFTRIHVPVASDLSRTSSDLLFAEPPTIYVAENDTASSKAQDRLDLLFGSDDTYTTLSEGGELASAHGGVFLRLWWDQEISDHVMMGVNSADMAVPTWRYDRLYAVTFWSVVASENGTWIRHLERHEPGRILHGLYEGDQGQLGRQIPLDQSPETAWAADLVDAEGAIETGVPWLTASYVANVKPNRKWRRTPGLAPMGRSDYDGVEMLFDALDEIVSSWMRDIDLGKARLFVDESLLQDQGPGLGASFDGEQAIFTPLRGSIGSMATGNNSGLFANQFNIRWEEHSRTVSEMLDMILRGAGISPGSFTDSSLSSAITATEVNSRDSLSERTRAKKMSLWRGGLGPLARTAMCIDADVFGSGATLSDIPDINFPPRSMQPPLEMAQTIAALMAAQAISTEQAVAERHPEWTDGEVQEEVDRIRADIAESTQSAGFGMGQEPLQNPQFHPPSPFNAEPEPQ